MRAPTPPSSCASPTVGGRRSDPRVPHTTRGPRPRNCCAVRLCLCPFAPQEKGEPEEAERCLRQAVERAQAAHDDAGGALAWCCLGDLLYTQGHFDDARRCFERDVRLSRLCLQEGDPALATALSNLGVAQVGVLCRVCILLRACRGLDA